MDSLNHIKHSTILLVGSVAGVALLGFWWFVMNNDQVVLTDTRTDAVSLVTVEDIAVQNTNFKSGQELVKAGDYSKAIIAFQSARQAAVSEAEIGMIDVSIALSHLAQRDIPAAIEVLQSVVTSTGALPRTKAFAVHYLVSIYYNYPSAATAEQLFSGNDYFTEILTSVENNYPEAINRLVTIGLSYASLPGLEIRKADFLLPTLFKARTEGDANSASSTRFLIATSLGSAQTYLLQPMSESEAKELPLIYNRLGQVLGQLRLAGETGFADPETAFRTGSAYARAQNQLIGTLNINLSYAAYLNQLSELGSSSPERETIISNLIESLVAEQGNPQVTQFYDSLAVLNTMTEPPVWFRSLTSARSDFRNLVESLPSPTPRQSS